MGWSKTHWCEGGDSVKCTGKCESTWCVTPEWNGDPCPECGGECMIVE